MFRLEGYTQNGLWKAGNAILLPFWNKNVLNADKSPPGQQLAFALNCDFTRRVTCNQLRNPDNDGGTRHLAAQCAEKLFSPDNRMTESSLEEVDRLHIVGIAEDRDRPQRQIILVDQERVGQCVIDAQVAVFGDIFYISCGEAL